MLPALTLQVIIAFVLFVHYAEAFQPLKARLVQRQRLLPLLPPVYGIDKLGNVKASTFISSAGLLSPLFASQMTIKAEKPSLWSRWRQFMDSLLYKTKKHLSLVTKSVLVSLLCFSILPSVSYAGSKKTDKGVITSSTNKKRVKKRNKKPSSSITSAKKSTSSGSSVGSKKAVSAPNAASEARLRRVVPPQPIPANSPSQNNDNNKLSALLQPLTYCFHSLTQSSKLAAAIATVVTGALLAMGVRRSRRVSSVSLEPAVRIQRRSKSTASNNNKRDTIDYDDNSSSGQDLSASGRFTRNSGRSSARSRRNADGGEENEHAETTTTAAARDSSGSNRRTEEIFVPPFATLITVSDTDINKNNNKAQNNNVNTNTMNNNNNVQSVSEPITSSSTSSSSSANTNANSNTQQSGGGLLQRLFGAQQKSAASQRVTDLRAALLLTLPETQQLQRRDEQVLRLLLAKLLVKEAHNYYNTQSNTDTNDNAKSNTMNDQKDPESGSDPTAAVSRFVWVRDTESLLQSAEVSRILQSEVESEEVLQISDFGSPEEIAVIFADLANAVLVAAIDQAHDSLRDLSSSSSSSRTAAANTTSTSTSSVADSVYVAMRVCGGVFAAVAPRVSDLPPLQYNGKLKRQQLEDVYAAALKQSLTLDLGLTPSLAPDNNNTNNNNNDVDNKSDSIDNYFNNASTNSEVVTDKPSTANNTDTSAEDQEAQQLQLLQQREEAAQERQQQLAQLQFLLQIKENKRAAIEQKVLMQVLLMSGETGEASGDLGALLGNLGGGLGNLGDLASKFGGLGNSLGGGAGELGELEKMLSQLSGMSEAEQEKLLQEMMATLPANNNNDNNHMPDMSNMSPAEVARMTQEALSGLQQALKQNQVTAKDVSEFEAMTGMDVAQFSQILGMAGRDRQMQQQLQQALGAGQPGGLSVTELEQLFRDLNNIKQQQKRK